VSERLAMNKYIYTIVYTCLSESTVIV